MGDCGGPAVALAARGLTGAKGRGQGSGGPAPRARGADPFSDGVDTDCDGLDGSGDPKILDFDTSASDIGAYGGPGGNLW